MDLDVGGDLAGADLHLLIAHQEVDLLRDHDVCINKNVGVEAVNDVELSSKDNFDSFASLDLSAGDPNCRVTYSDVECLLLEILLTCRARAIVRTVASGS